MTNLNYDPVIKDLFERDRPSMLRALAGNAAIRQFLNPELAAVE